MSDPNDWNAKIIKEFRENEGRVGGRFANATLLLLHTEGAKSGQTHVTPLMCKEDDDRLFVIASAGGAPSHPDWYHNIVANSAVVVEYGREQFPARAAVAEEPERSRLFDKMATDHPFFREYAEKTKGKRTIPVVTLQRIG